VKFVCGQGLNEFVLVLKAIFFLICVTESNGNMCHIYLLKAALRHAIFVKLHIGVASSPTDYLIGKKNETAK
jgi:hypothetical protein